MSTPTKEHVEAAQEIDDLLTNSSISPEELTDAMAEIIASHFPAHPPSGTAESLAMKLAVASLDFYTSDPKDDESLDLNVELAKKLAPLLAPLMEERNNFREWYESEKEQRLEVWTQAQAQLSQARKVVEECKKALDYSCPISKDYKAIRTRALASAKAFLEEGK